MNKQTSFKEKAINTSFPSFCSILDETSIGIMSHYFIPAVKLGEKCLPFC